MENSLQFNRRLMVIFQLLVLIGIFTLNTDALEFTKTNLELNRPVVVQETVRINCETDVKEVNLKLLKKKKDSDTFEVLKPDGQVIIQNGQNFIILISGKEDTGIYICDAFKDGERVQKSLNVYIAGKGKIPKPEVHVNPRNQVDEGTKLIIECRTRGTFAKLSWFKENLKIPDALVTNKEPYFVKGTIVIESILTINDVKLQDVGIYICKSVSRFDSSKSANATAIIKVRGRKLAWLRDVSSVFNAVQTRLDASVIISCSMTHPAKKVTFYKKANDQLSKLVIDGSKYQLLNAQELVIKNVRQEGTYVCRAENNLLGDKTIKLFVNQFAQQTPYARVTPSFLDLDFNAANNVTCTTYGNNVKVEWLRSVQEGSQTKLVKVPTEKIYASFSFTPQGKYRRDWTLIFTNVTEADAGSYLCKVTADTRPTFREVDVTVKPALAPQIRKFPAQVTKENVKTSLNCRSRGAPNPDIKFFKDGIEVVSGSNGYVIQGRKLHIEEPRYPEHDGLYTCSVSNMFGKATKKANLTVTVAPVIDKKEKIVVVGSEEKLKIACNIQRSNPVPKITWQFQPWPCSPDQEYNCKPISNKWQEANPAKYDIKPTNPITMSSVFKVPKSAVERFFVRCTAEHKYGKDTHQIIGIIDKRDATTLLRSSPSFETDEEKPFKLECTGDAGLFLNLTWKKDDKPIVITDSVTMETKGSVLEDQKIVLSVKKSTPQDSGFYECVGTPARIEDAPVIAGTQVVINKIYAPSIASFKHAIVHDSHKAIITCSVDSHPTAKVTWLKEGKPLVADPLQSIDECEARDEGKYFELVEVDTKVKPKHHKLVVCKADWKKNNGTYSCLATNDLGKVQRESSIFVYAPPVIVSPLSPNEYPKPDRSFSRNCTSEGNPLPYVWWEKEKNGKYELVSDNSTTGTSFLNISRIKENNYGTYRCVAINQLARVDDTMTLRKPVLIFGKHGSENTIAQTASLVAALIAAVLIIVILVVLVVILYKRKRLYGGFYILSIPPSPDYFRKLDPTRPVSEQTNKLPYFPEWEYPRNKIKLKNCVGAGAFGEVYIADAIGICGFDPRYKISTKHTPLLSKKRFSFTRSKTLSRQDSIASTRSSRSTKSLLSKDRNSVVAVKKLKEDATTTEYKDLISELKILIHIGQNEHIVNLLAACTKGVEKDSMVILEYCPHGNLLSFMKARRQMFKPIWSKQHVGIEKEFTTFDLCVAGYQVAKGLQFLASRKCVHRDVAARNVLVGENYVMKIADFGLARDVYKDESYVKMSGGLLPIKWMAIESIFDRVFTHSSDVWAYGVLMWEVMTLGGAPYPGLPAKELPEFLSAGNRMDQPPRCPNEVFQLILETWNELPSHRPTFDDIVLRLARVIEAHCNPEDVQLYLDKAHISGGSLSYEDQNYLKPIDPEHGSYKFQPPSNSSTLNRNNDVFSRTSSDRQSERYVTDNRFHDDDNTKERLLGDFDKGSDMNDGASDKSIEPKAKMDEMVSEKDYKANHALNNNEHSYQNETRLNSKETRLQMEDEKDTNEKSALLNEKTPSIVEALSSFIDEEYERMDRPDGYVNA